MTKLNKVNEIKTKAIINITNISLITYRKITNNEFQFKI